MEGSLRGTRAALVSSPNVFRLIDVFGTADFSGNPLAVISAGESLRTDEMQRIARWLNLSETAFLLAPTSPRADYRVRIFTLARELPFAGHPTLGACHAWLASGGRLPDGGVVVQECAAGLVPVRRSGDMLSFKAPPLVRSGPVDEAKLAEVAAVLRIDRGAIVDAQWVDNGPGWVAVLLVSAEEVRAIEPARHHPGRVDIGIVGAQAPDGETAFEIRAIFSDAHGGLVEDPATGSLNASVAQWLFATERAEAPYVAAQGTRIGRSGRVHVDRDDEGRVWVGGRTRTMFEGGLAFATHGGPEISALAGGK